jgi:hypothetical protein
VELSKKICKKYARFLKTPVTATGVKEIAVKRHAVLKYAYGEI